MEKEGIGDPSTTVIANLPQAITSAFEEGKGPLSRRPWDPDSVNLNIVQRALRSIASRVADGHVLSLQKQRYLKLDGVFSPNMNRPSASDDSTSRKEANADLMAVSRPLHSPNPFISEIFKLSFEVYPSLDLDKTVRTDHNRTPLGIIHRHGPYPTLHVGLVEYNTYLRRSVVYIYQRRTILATQSERQPQTTISKPLPPLRPFTAKIPWRGKNILVKLPPVAPASASIEGNNESLADHKSGIGPIDGK
jgi:hypothetical protein